MNLLSKIIGCVYFDLRVTNSYDVGDRISVESYELHESMQLPFFELV